MTGSYLQSKILDLQMRLQAANELNGNDSFLPGSRPGSGRRPKNLGNVQTPSRTRLYDDIQCSNFKPSTSIDPSELDRKMKEIMKMSGMVTIYGRKYPTVLNDLEHLGELGSGTCGHVVKMRHRPSNSIMAVKQMRWSGDHEENKRITMDLEVVLKSHDCPYIISCYGVFITDADVWICMELMATSFDKLSKRLGAPIPEDILGNVALAIVKALHYLKEKHGVIHRDVKPSNILLDSDGRIKLCDFGISGRLVNSKAKSGNAGCAAYMAPERISLPDPRRPDYDIRADVWSLGISLVELATGTFPYKDCKSDFEVLSRVLQDEPPALPRDGRFTAEFQSFVHVCLCKDYHKRPKYAQLLEHPFLRRYENRYVDVASWFAQSQRSPYSKWDEVSGMKRRNETDGAKKALFGGSGKDEGLKGVWNSIMRSPLFGRRKKSVETVTGGPPTPPPLPSQSSLLANTSPLLLQRFIHQSVNSQKKLNRSSSMSPTAQRASEDVRLRFPVRRPPSPSSPEPPPRINKMVSPLLLRRLALNPPPGSALPPELHFPLSSPSSVRPPQPPPRRKLAESKSVPCSPIPQHRYFSRSAWQQFDRS